MKNKAGDTKQARPANLHRGRMEDLLFEKIIGCLRGAWDRRCHIWKPLFQVNESFITQTPRRPFAHLNSVSSPHRAEAAGVSRLLFVLVQLQGRSRWHVERGPATRPPPLLPLRHRLASPSNPICVTGWVTAHLATKRLVKIPQSTNPGWNRRRKRLEKRCGCF